MDSCVWSWSRISKFTAESQRTQRSQRRDIGGLCIMGGMEGCVGKILSPLFSLVVLVQNNRHLLPLTLDTLKRQEAVFEVILLDGEGSGRLAEYAASYPELPIRVEETGAANKSEMMNRGLALSKAKYIQFLVPGERYISQHGLSYLSELIAKGGEPQLIYSSSLVRGPELSPQVVSFSLNRDFLRKGTAARSIWFCRNAVLNAGGFDARFTYRPSFDLLCRLFSNQEVRAVYSRRVLTDAEPHRPFAGEVIGYANETCRIVYRYFGFWPALKWVFVQDQFPVFLWAVALLKQAFCRKS